MSGHCRSWFLGLLVWVVAVTALPGLARAQTTGTTTGTGTGGPTVAMAQVLPVTRSSYRPGSESSTDSTYKFTISRADCKDSKLKYTFKLLLTNWRAGYVLKAWAGPASGDCAAQFIAPSNAFRSCWSLSEGVEPDLSGTTATAKFEFTPKQMFGIGATEGTPILNSCDDSNPAFQSAQSFGLYFMVTQPSVVVSSVKQVMNYALQGPVPPTTVTAGTADSSLHMTWKAIGATSGDVTYRFYCAPNEGNAADGECTSSALLAAGAGTATASGGSSGTDGSGGSTGSGGTSSGGTSATVAGGATDRSNVADTLDAGTAGTAGVAGHAEVAGNAGAGGGAATSSMAGASALALGAAGSSSGATSATTSGGQVASGGAGTSVGGSAASSVAAGGATSSSSANTVLDFSGVTPCGEKVGRNNTDAYTSAILENEKSYAVSVAVVDRYGNVGALSTPVCGTPMAVTTFFDAYRRDGGKAGGGFCNIDLRRNANTLPVALVSLLLVGLIRRKRRATRSRRLPPTSNC